MKKHFVESKIEPEQLWAMCVAYVKAPSKSHLLELIQALGFAKTSAAGAPIAVAATFPAFADPERIPMVNQRIAKWVSKSRKAHNAADPGGPQLQEPRFIEGSETTLQLRDFPFVESWYAWCQHTASKLQRLTAVDWRARDVEMAIFNSWGNRGQPHPYLALEALPKL